MIYIQKNCMVNDCEQFLLKVEELLEENELKEKIYNEKLKKYSAWEDEYKIQQQKLEAGYTAPNGFIVSSDDGTFKSCLGMNMTTDCYRASGDSRRCMALYGYGCDCNWKSPGCKSYEPKNEYKTDPLKRYNWYRKKYDEWIKANPKPEKPIQPQLPEIDVNLACAECNQIFEVEGTANTITVEDIELYQECSARIGNQHTTETAKPTAKPTTGAAKLTAKPTTGAETDTKDVESLFDFTNLKENIVIIAIIILIFIIVFVLLGISIYFVISSKRKPRVI